MTNFPWLSLIFFPIGEDRGLKPLCSATPGYTVGSLFSEFPNLKNFFFGPSKIKGKNPYLTKNKQWMTELFQQLKKISFISYDRNRGFSSEVLSQTGNSNLIYVSLITPQCKRQQHKKFRSHYSVLRNKLNGGFD